MSNKFDNILIKMSKIMSNHVYFAHCSQYKSRLCKVILSFFLNCHCLSISVKTVLKKIMPNKLVALTFFAFFTAYSEAECPFPGAPKNGLALFNGNALHPDSISTIKAFNSRDTITYKCDKGWMPTINYPLLCQEDGTWEGSVPKCCKFLKLISCI